MRKLRVPAAGRGGEEKLGVLAFEAAALMSRLAGLWRALGDAPLARLRGDAVLRLEGARRLVADDDGALLALALAEMAGACAALSRAVARLAARCQDPLLRRFEALYAALVGAGGGKTDPHGVRYAKAGKMDRRAREMQRLVALTAHLGHELDVLAELEQALALRSRRASSSSGDEECARRVARQRREVERLRAASLWGRTFDYAVRLLARALFTVVARIVDVFGLQPSSSSDSDGEEDESSSSSSSSSSAKVVSRLSWSSGGMHLHSMVYPSDVVVDTPRRSGPSGGKKIGAGADDARRFLMARSRSLRQQLRWPAAAGRHLVGCVVAAGGRSSSPGRDGWVHHVRGDADLQLPLSFSYVSDELSTTNFQFQSAHDTHTRARARPSTTSVFEPSRHDVLASAPATTLGGAGLALHYANLIMLIDRLAASPRDICADERDALYGMLTASVRAALGARLRPLAKRRFRGGCDPVLAAEWADTVQRILAWLAPLARNMVRWHAERSFEQRSVAPGAGAGVLLLQTLHFADRRKTEAALTELLVGLDYVWRHAMELDAKAGLGGTTAGRPR